MNTKVGRPAYARRPFIFKVMVRRLDWMVMALICLYPACYFEEEPYQERYYVLNGKTVFRDLV